MATVEERLKVLKMVEARQITVEEAERLLAALDEDRPGGDRAGSAGNARWFRVRVTNAATGRDKVNLNLPIGLLDLGLKVGARFAPDMHETDLGRVLSAIRSGASGKIVDVRDASDGDHVEVFVE